YKRWRGRHEGSERGEQRSYSCNPQARWRILELQTARAAVFAARPRVRRPNACAVRRARDIHCVCKPRQSPVHRTKVDARGRRVMRFQPAPIKRRVTEMVLDSVAAEERIRGRVIETPLILSEWLSKIAGAQVYLKLENLQNTGSFKLRGAANKLL